MRSSDASVGGSGAGAAITESGSRRGSDVILLLSRAFYRKKLEAKRAARAQAGAGAVCARGPTPQHACAAPLHRRPDSEIDLRIRARVSPASAVCECLV